MASPRLLVVGPIMRDVTVLIDRPPDPDMVAVADGLRVEVGGKGGTPALVAAALGAEARLLGAVGDDEEGALALAELRDAGVEVDAVERLVGASTGHVVTLVDGDGARRHIEWNGANAVATRTAEEVAEAAAGCSAVVVSAASPRPLVEAAVEGARAAGAFVLLDAAGDPDTSRAVLGKVTIVRADADEAAALIGSPVEDFDSASGAANCLLEEGPALAVVQAGEEGDVFLASDQTELRLPHIEVESVDPTGAGDALGTTLAVLLAEGRPLAEAARLAEAAAAHAVAHLGAQPTFDGEDELVRLADRPPGTSPHHTS